MLPSSLITVVGPVTFISRSCGDGPSGVLTFAMGPDEAYIHRKQWTAAVSSDRHSNKMSHAELPSALA